MTARSFYFILYGGNACYTSLGSDVSGATVSPIALQYGYI